MQSDRLKNLQECQRAVDTAISYAPLEAVLGDRLARKYQVRELTETDGIYMHERAARRIRTITNRTWSYAATIVHVDKPRHPLFSLIASKYKTASTVLTVHDTHAELQHVDDELAGKLVHVLLLTAQTFAYLADAKSIKVKDTSDSRLQGILRACGYDVSKRERGLLYGTRKVLTSLSPHTPH